MLLPLIFAYGASLPAKLAEFLFGREVDGGYFVGAEKEGHLDLGQAPRTPLAVQVMLFAFGGDASVTAVPFIV